MPKKNELLLMHELLHIKHQDVRWSNFLIKAAFACSLIEKRALYFISLWVKRNFTEKELGVPDNWKNLYMHLTDADLGIIGGTKNIPRTYEALKQLARKLVSVSYVNDRGERVNGRIHWIDAFFYNTATKEYDVRVSPEILPYMINVEKNFTTIDVGEAMTFRSKVTQKIYEFLSMYSGNYRYTDTELKANGYVYAKNVIPVDIEQLRNLFCLDEVKDSRTGKIERGVKYPNFNSIKRFVLEKAQKELYTHFMAGTGCLWFDYQVEDGLKRGCRVKKVVFYLYTKKSPKEGPMRPWQEGDELLTPYEKSFEPAPKLTPQQKIHANPLYSLDVNNKEYVLADLLKKYLEEEEVNYYMHMAMLEMNRRLFNKTDVIMQMIQVILDKEKQKSFRTGSASYRRKNLINYVFTFNLQEDYGWSIPPMKKEKSSKGKSPLEKRKADR